MSAPDGNLDATLWMMRRLIETLEPNLEGKSSWVDRQYSDLKRNWGDGDWHLRGISNAHLFPNSDAYATTTWEDIQGMEAWGAEDVETYLRDYVHPKNATLMIVGNVTKEEALKQAETYFGGWTPLPGSAQATFDPLVAPDMPTEVARTILIDEEKRTQTETQMVCRLNYRGDEDKAAVDVLSSLVRNRVFTTLRVKEGLAYSPGGAAFTQPDDAALLFFSSLAVNSGVGRTLEFFKETVAELEAGNVSPEELKLHQLRLNREEGVSMQSVDQMAGALRSTVSSGKSWNEMAARGDMVAAVTVDDLARLTGGCLDHALVTLRGPESVITEQLDEKGYPYEIFDHEPIGDELLWKYDPKAAKKKEKAKAKADKKKAKKEAAEGTDEATDAADEAAEAEDAPTPAEEPAPETDTADEAEDAPEAEAADGEDGDTSDAE